MKFVFIVWLTIFSLPILAEESNSSKRIKGVADFLVDRANDNYLYIFEKKIKENEDLQCYFPNVYKNLSVGGQGTLKNLLVSRKLWRDSIKKDLEVLAIRTVAKELEKSLKISKKATSFSSLVIEFYQKLDFKYQGQKYSLIVTPIDADEEFLNIQDDFYRSPESIMNAALVFNKYYSDPDDKKAICNSPTDDFKAFKKNIDGLYHLKTHIQDWQKQFKKHSRAISVNDAFAKDVCSSIGLADCSTKDKAISSLKTEHGKVLSYFAEQYYKIATSSDNTNTFENISASVQDIYLAIDAIDKNDNVSAAVIRLLEKLRNAEVMSENDFKRLSKHTLFFALIADAESADEVSSILKNYTLPAVSFYIKRDAGSHLMISSYLGVSYNANDEDFPDDKNNEYGIFAPVGLEYSFGQIDIFNLNGSVSVMLSPFDFGYPINLKFNDIEDDVEFDEIVAPSITLAYGLQQYPLVWGVGYQKGVTIEGTNDTEERALLFVAFDMPLFNLFD